MTVNELMHRVKDHIEFSVQIYLVYMAAPIQGYPETSALGGSFSYLISYMDSSYEASGFTLEAKARADCTKKLLRILSKKSDLNSKLFDILMDYYALYEEASVYAENPTGSYTDYATKFNEFFTKFKKYNSKIEILMD